MSDYFDLYKKYCIEEDKNLVEGIMFKEGKAWSDPFICILPDHAGDKSNKQASINRVTGAYNCFTHCHHKSIAEIISIFTSVSTEESWNTVASFRENNKKEIVLDDTAGVSKFLPTRNPHFERLYKLSLENLSPDILEVREYIWSRKITFETLQKLGIGWLPETETSWHRASLVFPYMADGKVIGLRYRDAGTSKSYEVGSYPYIWGLDTLSEEANPVVIITEGESDRCTTWQALNGEYPVISIPGSHFQASWKRELSGIGNLVFLMQDDDASKNLAKSIESSYKDVKIIPLPWKRGQIYGKDVADWLRYNEPGDLKKLIETRVDLRRKGFMSGVDFKEQSDKEEDWIIENLLSKKNLMAFGGFAKSKKTICAINLLKSLITGENFLGIPEYKPVIPEGGYKMLFIEEEGSDRELCGRLNSIFGDVPWENNTFWGYSQGTDITDAFWTDYIINFCKTNKIDVMFFDPFARVIGASTDENSAKDMQLVFNNLANIKREVENLSIVLIHHFVKSGVIEAGLKNFRGSGAFVAELDMSILMENIPNTGNRGIKVIPKGRKKDPKFPDNKEYFCFQLNDDLTMTLSDEESLTGTSPNKFNLEQLSEYLRGSKGIVITELAKNYGTSVDAIIAYVKSKSDTFRLIGSSASKDTMKVLLK